MTPRAAGMAEYVLAEGAEADLSDIAGYTFTVWGARQARSYGEALTRARRQLHCPVGDVHPKLTHLISQGCPP